MPSVRLSVLSSDDDLDGGGPGQVADRGVPLHVDRGRAHRHVPSLLDLPGGAGNVDWGVSSDLVTDEDAFQIHFQMDHWCNTSHIEALDGLDWTLDEKKNYSIPM